MTVMSWSVFLIGQQLFVHQRWRCIIWYKPPSTTHEKTRVEVVGYANIFDKKCINFSEEKTRSREYQQATQNGIDMRVFMLK